jgi:hypothetical protein
MFNYALHFPSVSPLTRLPAISTVDIAAPSSSASTP